MAKLKRREEKKKEDCWDLTRLVRDKDDYTKAYTSAIVFNSNSTINLVRNFVSASFPSKYIYNPRSYNGTQNYSTGTEITTSGGLVAFNWNGAMVENTYNLGYTSDIYFRVGFNLNSKDFFNYKSSGFTLNSITGIYLYNLAVLPNFTSVSTSNTKEKYYIKAEL